VLVVTLKGLNKKKNVKKKEQATGILLYARGGFFRPYRHLAAAVALCCDLIFICYVFGGFFTRRSELR
jgi:hypothetical protein